MSLTYNPKSFLNQLNELFCTTQQPTNQFNELSYINQTTLLNQHNEPTNTLLLAPNQSNEPPYQSTQQLQINTRLHQINLRLSSNQSTTLHYIQHALQKSTQLTT